MASHFPLPIVFIALYGALALVILFQLTVAVITTREQRRQRLLSYRTYFNLLCLVWTTLRFVFWLLLHTEDDEISPIVLEFMLFWLPHALQYVTFTLLALFFFKAINRVRHVRYHRAAYSFFGISAVVVFVLVCVEAAYRGITADAGDSVATQRWNDSEQITVGIVFFFMSLFYLTIAVRVWGMNPSDYSRALLEQSQRMVGHITFALFVVFASRSVFNFVSAAGDVDVTVNTDAVGDNIASFTIYAFWELFPVSLLLVTVASGGPVLPAIYRKRQFGVKGSGAVTRGHTHPSAMNRSNNTNTGDAMSSLTSYEVYMESPGPLSRENSYRYAAVVPSHDDTGIQVIGETVESELKGTPGRRSKHSRRHDKHDIRVELDDVNDYSDVDVAADVRVTVRDSKHVETVDLLQPLLRSEQLRPAVSPVLDVSDMSVGSRPTVRSQPIATRSHDSNGFTVTRGASNLSQGRNGSRGGKRGLAAGAKARIVSLGGDEPGYDGYPVYTEFVGSYGGVGSYSEQPSPSLRPYSRGNTHSDPPPPPAWNVY